MMCDVPTVKEELDRKTVEALAEMTLNHDKGMMSKEAYYQSLTAINLVTNGLIDEEVSLVISENLKDNIPSLILKRIFVSEGVTVVISRVMTEDSFSMTQIASGTTTMKQTKKSFEDADDPIKACSLAVEKLATQLEGRGFKEV